MYVYAPTKTAASKLHKYNAYAVKFMYYAYIIAMFVFL